ncbi:hypothetical protein E2P81_ATG05308 [Venturia nashicola]|uniref:Uncharacterized protein n=1 Tax=Venturia nashicola TaxID=86259 RepID=A0A4Z1P2Z5_9PEZI|nr:hypothetical protein E6O75_ATG05443 [Venturia nashicola]TLD32332.1 hypothetical protein E2P81_ATG05308 [Venturia nashicola]
MKFSIVSITLILAALAVAAPQNRNNGNGGNSNTNSNSNSNSNTNSGSNSNSNSNSGNGQANNQNSNSNNGNNNNGNANANANGSNGRNPSGQVSQDQAQLMQTAIDAWMRDTGVVSNFLNIGPNIQDEQTFKNQAQIAHSAEVDELTHKAVLDQFMPDNQNVKAANSTLSNGAFQLVVDRLDDMSRQGFSQKNGIDDINKDRCINVLPNIDTYMREGANTIGNGQVTQQSVRPAACANTVAGQNGAAQVNQPPQGYINGKLTNVNLYNGGGNNNNNNNQNNNGQQNNGQQNNGQQNNGQQNNGQQNNGQQNNGQQNNGQQNNGQQNNGQQQQQSNNGQQSNQNDRNNAN